MGQNSMDKHCRSCGAELTEPVGSHCPNCGAEIVGAQKPETPAKAEADQPSGPVPKAQAGQESSGSGPQKPFASSKTPAPPPPSKKKSGSSNRTPLVIAGAVVAVVIVVIAIVVISGSGSGSDSSANTSPNALPIADELPANTVAVVTHVPASLRTITVADLKRSIAQVTAAGNLKSTPTPGDPKYEELEESGLLSLLEQIWIQGEGAEMGFSVTDMEIAAELAKLKKKNFKSDQEFQDFLKSSHYTKADVLERVEIQILSAKIQEHLSSETQGKGKAAKEKSFSDFVRAFQNRWHSRTVCAEAYVIEGCSNGPAPKNSSGSPGDLNAP